MNPRAQEVERALQFFKSKTKNYPKSALRTKTMFYTTDFFAKQRRYKISNFNT